jgi:hypothetical protein
MKKVIAGILLMASVGYAAPIVHVELPTQRTKTDLPKKVELNGQWYHNPSWEQVKQVGWRKFDQATIPSRSNDYQRVSFTYVQDTNNSDYAVMEVVDVYNSSEVFNREESQELSASLDALVFVELGEHIDGTDEQLARLSAVVVSNLESNRIEYAAAETLAELQTAGAHINNLRSIISLQAKIVSLQL